MNPRSEADCLRYAAQVEAEYRAAHITDLADVRSQLAAKRALEIAVAGRHTITLTGAAPTDIRHLRSAFPSIGGDPAMFVDDGDIRVVVVPATQADIVIADPVEPTEVIRARIARARAAIPAVGGYDPGAEQLLERVRDRDLDVEQVERLCPTIAALEGAPCIARPHVAEALTLRWRPSR
jgi:hypothetical protein